jgi:hypothetical protein
LAVATKFPESPKSSGKNPCLSGFQVGQPLGNVKTAEVRCICIVKIIMDNGRKENQNEEDKVALDDAVRMVTNLDY